MAHGKQAIRWDLVEQARSHWPDAWGLAFHLTGDASAAEDVAQEAMLRLAGMTEVDAARPLRGLLLVIVRNLVIDEARRPSVRSWSAEDDPRPDPRALDPAEVAGRTEQLARLRQGLERLSPNWRAVLYLRDGLNLGYAEIAEFVGISRDMVRTTLHRARMRIREVLGGLVAEESE